MAVKNNSSILRSHVLVRRPIQQLGASPVHSAVFPTVGFPTVGLMLVLLLVSL